MVADLLHLSFPYADYLLPLAIGLCAGGLCVMFGRRLLAPTAVLPRPQAKGFYDPFAQGSPDEHRKSPRRGGNPVEIYLARPADKNHPKRGWVLDRSIGGLCLWVNEELATDSVWAVLPINASEMTPWIDVEIVHCRAKDKGFEVGCRFIKAPPSLILMQFG